MMRYPATVGRVAAAIVVALLAASCSGGSTAHTPSRGTRVARGAITTRPVTVRPVARGSGGARKAVLARVDITMSPSTGARLAVRITGPSRANVQWQAAAWDAV